MYVRECEGVCGMCVCACYQPVAVFVTSPARVVLSSWWPVVGGQLPLFHTLGNRLSSLKSLAPKVTQLEGDRAGLWNPGLAAQPVSFLEATEPPCPSGPSRPPTKMCAPGEGDGCIRVWEDPAKPLRR